jgi:DNA-directed RNA polymerase specialized sigma24 family protein
MGGVKVRPCIRVGDEKELCMSRFPTTQWSLVKLAHNESPTGAREHMGKLLQRYWNPMFVHLRCKGFAVEKAEDLIQDFMVEILNKDLLAVADPTRGKFRTLLLTALDRFAISDHRRATATKRSPQNVVPLDEAAETAASADMTPDLIFERAWAINVLAGSLAKMKEECVSLSNLSRWNIFESRIVAPLLDDAHMPKYDELAWSHGLENDKAAMNVLVTAKRQFARTLRDTVRDYVTRGSEHVASREILADDIRARTGQTKDSDLPAREASQQVDHAIQQAVEDELLQLRSILERSRAVAHLVDSVSRDVVSSGDPNSAFFRRLAHSSIATCSSLDTAFAWGDAPLDAGAPALGAYWENLLAEKLADLPNLDSVSEGTIGDLLLDPRSVMLHLVALKDWANLQRLAPSAGLPKPIANALFHLSLCAGVLHHDKLITGLRPDIVKSALIALLSEPWIGKPWVDLIERGIDRLNRRVE